MLIFFHQHASVKPAYMILVISNTAKLVEMKLDICYWCYVLGAGGEHFGSVSRLQVGYKSFGGKVEEIC